MDLLKLIYTYASINIIEYIEYVSAYYILGIYMYILFYYVYLNEVRRIHYVIMRYNSQY